MDELLALAQRSPHRTLTTDEVLLVDGEAVGGLYVLLDGRLRIDKGGTAIASVTDAGAYVGEMSLLLGIPATADVVAAEPSVVAVIDDAPARLEQDSAFALALARLLASRLQVMTGYLVDLRTQYAGHDGGLGMVDVVLDSLMRHSGPPSRLGSLRDPEPEY